MLGALLFQTFPNLHQRDDNVCYICSGCSVRSWSKPPRGMAPPLSEGRRRALMSRLWGHSECSDLWDWYLEYPVSTYTRDKSQEKWGGLVPRGSGVNGDWVSCDRNEPEDGADIAARWHKNVSNGAQLDRGRRARALTLSECISISSLRWQLQNWYWSSGLHTSYRPQQLDLIEWVCPVICSESVS